MSMTRDQLLRYLDNPSALNEKSSAELREILDEYPYFQTAHLLYIRNLQNESSFRFSGQLNSSAVYIADRTMLYHLLNPGLGKRGKTDHSSKISPAARGDEYPMIELSEGVSGLRTADTGQAGNSAGEAEMGRFDLLNFELQDSGYYLEGVENDSEIPLSEVAREISHLAAKKTRGKESVQNANLIDRFIKDNPSFSVRPPDNPEKGEKSQVKNDSTGEPDEFITETLARIYVNQGLYAKAIKAFEKLSLKYPEKSVYFARQIEEVTNLLNK